MLPLTIIIDINYLTFNAIWSRWQGTHPVITQRSISLRALIFCHLNQISIESFVCSYKDSNTMIVTELCSWHGSYIIVTFVKINNDLNVMNGHTPKCFFTDFFFFDYGRKLLVGWSLLSRSNTLKVKRTAVTTVAIWQIYNVLLASGVFIKPGAQFR